MSNYLESYTIIVINKLNFNQFSIEFKVKKEGWGGGGTRQIKFNQSGFGDKEILTAAGKILTITIGPGLPCTSSKLN